MFKNKKIILALLVSLVVLIIGMKIWNHAAWWESIITNGDEWYSKPELSRMEVRDTYGLAFKQIVLIGGFIFTSAFLFLKALEKDNK